MNIVDLVLVAVVALALLLGWRNGLVAGVLSFAGFIGGALVGATIAPHLLGSMSGLVAAALGIGIVVVSAGIGNSLASLGARWLRSRVTWKPVRMVDSVGGSAFGAASVVLVAWVVASALVSVPIDSVSGAVRTSRILGAVDGSIPDTARGWVGGLRSALDSTGFPEAFAGLALDPVIPVAQPYPALLKDPAGRASINSLVKVEGIARECSTQVDGSGFVFARNHVMTNAHVVAGVDHPIVMVRGVGQPYAARVVYIDPNIDVAVLIVPGLDASSLDFNLNAHRGDPVVIAGFPGGGPLTATPGRIRGTIAARGSDIYGHGTVTREIYSVRGTVRPGNSGGPLLSADGHVDGVIFAAAVDDPDTGYALTAQQVAHAASVGARATAAVDTGSCSTH